MANLPNSVIPNIKDSEILRILHDHNKGDKEVISYLLQNPYTPRDVRIKIARDENLGVLSTDHVVFAARMCSNPDILTNIYTEFPEDEVKRALAENSYTPASVLVKIALENKTN